MKLIRVQGWNFGSYKNLLFEFQKDGLTLLSGPTGAGKSTLCDIVPWVLFGRTAKNGAADDVIAWGDKVSTSGVIYLTINNKEVEVFRRRGASKDLYFTVDGSETTRGKDISDTQKLLNDVLGVDADLFLASSYYHEFSQTASFFTANAKTRRQLTEQLVDLSFSSKLTESLTEYKKAQKLEITQLKDNISQTHPVVNMLKTSLQEAEQRSQEWDKAKLERGQNSEKAYAKQLKAFEKDQQNQLKALNEELAQIEASILDPAVVKEKVAKIDKEIARLSKDTCSECGSTKHSAKILVLTKDKNKLELEYAYHSTDVQKAIRNIERQIARVKAAPAPEPPALVPTENPFDSVIEANLKKLTNLVAKAASYQTLLNKANDDLSDLELLSSTVESLRMELIKSTINELEQATNALLTAHFDAEIKVEFSGSEADKLEIEIFKDGNRSNFAQLSKGQRQLLKLCFGVSVMQTIANRHAFKPSCLFFDECLDGMSDDFKLKALGLFNSLAAQYDDVFVVEHSEGMKPMFTNRYDIQLIEGHSAIEKAH